MSLPTTINKDTRHSMPLVFIPHLALMGNKVLVSDEDKAFMDDTFNKSVHSFYQDNKEFGFDLMKFNLENNFGDEVIITKLLNAEPYSLEQVILLQELSMKTLDSLGNYCDDSVKNWHSVFSSYDIKISDNLSNYCKQEFTPSLSITDGTCSEYGSESEYGDYDELALRLDSTSLSVVCIDSLYSAPYALQVIGGLIIRRIAFISEKYTAKALWADQGLMCDPDSIECFKKLSCRDKNEISSFLSDGDMESVIDVMLSSKIDFGFDCEDDDQREELEHNLTAFLDLDECAPYLDTHLEAEFEHDTFVEVINNEIEKINTCQSPLKSHPLFIHLSKLAKLYILHYKHVENCTEQGSDMGLSYYSIISLDMEKEQPMLDDHNQYLGELSEIGAIKLDIKSPDVLTYLDNFILSDMMLCAF
jgi:hypothetical protein